MALPLCLAEIPILVYLPAFYIQELKLEAAVVGGIFFFVRAWDGLSNLLVGWLSDRFELRWGRRKPWALAGAPLLMISTWFLCNPKSGAGLSYLCVWAALFYASFTAVKVPHLSWGTELATDYVERSRVTTYREAFTMLASLLFVCAPLALLRENPSIGATLFLLSVLTVVFVPITVVPAALCVPDPLPTRPIEGHFIRELADLTRDRVLLRFLLARFLFAVEEGVTNSLLIFTFTVGLGLSTSVFFWVILILYVSNLVTMPATLRLARRVEKHVLLAVAVTIQALVFSMLVVPPFSPSLAWVGLLWAVLGIAGTAMLSIPMSILADIIDRGQLLTGERRAGTYVAVDNLTYKLGMALGVGASLGLLALVHFNPTGAQHSAADILHIRLLGFGLPCVLSIPAALLFLTHPITRQAQKRLRERLDVDAGALVREHVSGTGP